MENLKKENIWVNWNRDAIKGKVPINSKTLGFAQTNNELTWSSYDEADFNIMGSKADGIGFVFRSGLAGIDIDANLENWSNPLTNEIVDLFKGTYIETSPSGKGRHIIFKVDNNKIPLNSDGKWNDEKYYKKNPKNNLECYVGGFTSRFFTFTDNKLDCSSEKITDQTDNLLIFLDKYMKKKGSKNFEKKATTKQNPIAWDNKNMTLENILNKARNSKNGADFCALYDNGNISKYNGDDSAADAGLCTKLAYWLYNFGGEDAIDTAFRNSALYREKWEREDYRKATIKYAINSCEGTFYNKRNLSKKEKMAASESVTTIQEELDSLDCDKNGVIKVCENDKAYNKVDYYRNLGVLNLEAFEEELKNLGISIKHNLISNNIDISGYSEKESAEHILATLPTLLYSELSEHYKKGVTQQLISDFIFVVSTRNRYNPVLDLLASQVWDKQDHLKDLYDALNLKEDDELSRILIKKWFWQGLALLRNNSSDPFGADGILTLSGKQGIGKTSFFRKIALSHKFFREGQRIDDRDKDSARRCVTTWIAELGEIDTTLKSDIGMLKAFITNAYDEYRLPYGRVDQQTPRRTNVGATVNGTQFLVDPTGNRRFWTIPLDTIDLDKLAKINAIQIWEQVWEQEAKDNLFGFRLTKEEQAQLAERNASCEKATKAEDEILDIVQEAKDTVKYDMRYMTVSEFKLRNETLKNYSVDQIGRALTKLGIVAERITEKGITRRVRKLPYKYSI